MQVELFRPVICSAVVSESQPTATDGGCIGQERAPVFECFARVRSDEC